MICGFYFLIKRKKNPILLCLVNLEKRFEHELLKFLEKIRAEF